MRALELTATFSLGLLTGAMLLIGGAIVPFWSSLEPAAFAEWFARNSGYLGNVMVPLGGLTLLLALVAAAGAWRARRPERRHFAATAALTAVVALIYFVEHASLNARIASGTLTPDEVASALESWRAWHWLRTAAGAAGFLTALAGLAA